ncbi:hypothetical protein [Azospirillum sp. B506]|uniref:hypothetical protein n=1 Tax=Azospirillum sp. B506 TaxID=137721 RepID=UPI000345315C|nr:hypothetical protein [Azospirillum sp. B506]
MHEPDWLRLIAEGPAALVRRQEQALREEAAGLLAVVPEVTAEPPAESLAVLEERRRTLERQRSDRETELAAVRDALLAGCRRRLSVLAYREGLEQVREAQAAFGDDVGHLSPAELQVRLSGMADELTRRRAGWHSRILALCEARARTGAVLRALDDARRESAEAEAEARRAAAALRTGEHSVTDAVIDRCLALSGKDLASVDKFLKRSLADARWEHRHGVEAQPLAEIL